MNRHLNIFKTYTKEDRNYQLENDLTRAFAITLLENQLFLHEVLKQILSKKEGYYDNTFDDFSGKDEIQIDIQKNVSELSEYEHLFAVSLSGHKMDTDTFFNQQNDAEYDPITDLVIIIHNVAIIFEVKPNDYDCTSQLYNQALNAFDRNISSENVTPVDLNWHKLMEIALQTSNFEKAIAQPSRFLTDFIHFIRGHNFKWLPQVPLSALSLLGDIRRVTDRLETAITQSNFESISGRLGFIGGLPWAHEVLFQIKPEDQTIEARIYPGNIKRQGEYIFKGNTEPQFSDKLTIYNNDLKVYKKHHIKLTSWKRYFAGLWFTDSNLITPFYNRKNFDNHSGRKKKGKDWNDIAQLFDNHFKPEYKWREYSEWDSKVLKSGKSQFDISFGYELMIAIPFSVFKELDTDRNDVSGLIRLFSEIKNSFESTLIS